MARNPKPTALKELNGNPSGRPLPIEPKYPAMDTAAPADLRPLARVEWDRLAPMLALQGVATAADYSVVHDYCFAFGACRELQQLLACEGMIIENKNGERQRHPALLALVAVQRQLEAARIQLGLTPIARARVTGKEDDGEATEQWEG